MRAISIPLLLAMGLALGGAKPASEWTGASQAHSRALGAQYATCLVKTSRPIVITTLNAPFGNPETVTRFSAMMKGACLDHLLKPKMVTAPSALQIPPLVGRGLLYEALYREDFSAVRDTARLAKTQVVTYPIADLDRPGSLGRDYRALMRIGECTVRAAPNEARALVLSKVASKQEIAAIAALRQFRLACSSAAARQLDFSPTVERGMIAEPLYRLTEATMSRASKERG